MAAKDYKLCVSPLTGTVYISKISKSNPNTMTDDRREVPKGEFLKAMSEFIYFNNIDNVTANGEIILEIKKMKDGIF